MIIQIGPNAVAMDAAGLDELLDVLDAEIADARKTATRCVICGTPTTNTQRATIGNRCGAVCKDCAFWCDGNLAAPA